MMKMESKSASAEEGAALLVTFCNVFPLGFGLAEFSVKQGLFKWHEINTAERIGGATGAVCFRNMLVVLVQHCNSLRSSLAFLSREYELLKIAPLTLVSDGHSLIVHQEGLLIADTGHDRLVYAAVDGSLNVVEEVFWAITREDGVPRHLNSVARWKDGIYVSLFGPKPCTEAGWHDCRAGKVVNTSSAQVVAQNLYHPHSLAVHGEYLYWLESGTGAIYQAESPCQCRVIGNAGGYARGILVTDDLIFVGISAARRRAKGVGTLRIDASSDPHKPSGIVCIDRSNGALKNIDVSLAGAEIYDILPSFKPDGVFSPVAAVRERFLALETAYGRLRSELGERAVWAQKQEVELKKAQEAYAQLRTEFEERTAWAQKQGVELKKAQEAYAKLRTEFEERTAWAQKQGVELKKAQEAYAKLRSEFEERTAWAQKQEVELKKTQEAYAKLRSEFEERTARQAKVPA
jgi:hypothetical protein